MLVISNISNSLL